MRVPLDTNDCGSDDCLVSDTSSGLLDGNSDIREPTAEGSDIREPDALSDTAAGGVEDDLVPDDSGPAEEIVGHADGTPLGYVPVYEQESDEEASAHDVEEKAEPPTEGEEPVILSNGEQAKGWLRRNPGKAACIGTGAVMLLGPGVIVAPALQALGFGAGGVAAGSIAAAVQSSIGSVAAGGVFATLQSAAASGYGAATVYGAVQAGGVGLVAAGAASSRRTKQE